MHPGRRNILIRWVGYGIVVLGTVGWLATKDHQIPTFKSTVLERLAPKQVAIPTDEATKAIRAAIDVLKGAKATYAKVDVVDPALIVLEEEVLKEQGRQSLQLSSISIGPKSRHVVLSGAVYQEGDTLPDGRLIKRIEPDAVVFGVGDTEERQNWQPPFRVELRRPERDKTEKVFDPTQTQPGAESVEGHAGTGTVDVGQLPPDLTPDQALQILQQLGKQK
ncbi:type II secretory pathway component PulC [Desulfobaculum xiamenense]|uniref:Type II secretory pathway component PulC n=1 Tax=Desulfobaculum xiamenense TaxID=995050 RepID=A0A846QI48_9BACT|nr:hypothetical protein [Desulfobaculum xiamenense]NJB67861.1 type II secretory pathway component PulC [Desulfobaculum xiamenense]